MYSYFGKTKISTDFASEKYINVNNFGHIEKAKNLNICREHGRKDFQLIFVSSGKFVIKEKSAETIAKSGDICIFRPGESQKYGVANEETTYHWIHFSGKSAEEMLSFFKKRVYTVGEFPEFENYCRMIINEFELDSMYSNLYLEGKFITLISRIAKRILKSEKENKSLTKIRPALEIMKSECHQRRSNDELAKMCGVSKNCFMKLFKETTGISPQQYYQNQIIDKSIYFLTNTSYNIAEIANLCGIEDAFYFSRMFKKHTGFSPSDYRKKN